MEQLVARLKTEAVDLAMVGEAWLPQLRSHLKPFGHPSLFKPLLGAGRDPSVLGGTMESPMAFPWAFGSWVMVFRSRQAWAERARSQGWSLLADQELKNAWILPASPRVVMALALQSLGESPNTRDLSRVDGLAGRLATVVGQARAFDSRDALTRLVNGHGEAAVMPSWTVIPQLLPDQRLVAVRPTNVPPLLSWQVLVRPRQAGSVPLPWLHGVTTGKPLNALLQAGFCPPLPVNDLQPQLAHQPAAALLHPGDTLVNRGETLESLGPEQQKQYQEFWDQAMERRLQGGGTGVDG